MDKDYYARKPLGYRNGIPVFFREDEYTNNYERISKDHRAYFKEKDANPWMEEGLSVELEDSTAILVRAHSHPGDRILDNLFTYSYKRTYWLLLEGSLQLC